MREITTEGSQINNVALREDGIDPHAFTIVKALQRKGYVTYLVGGCVRDLLLNKSPKDFDIATSAKPQEIRQSVHNAFIIGKRFRLVLVKRDGISYEVSTFRRDAGPEDTVEEVPAGDNLFGSPEEDARRRDFTINALFYDPAEKKLIDYARGLPDLKDGLVRMIGDPNVRLLEDPIRIMRGVRLAHMLRFSLESELRKAMQTHAHHLAQTALPRRREEFLKYLRLDNPALPFLTSLDLGVLDHIAPTLAEQMRDTATSELFVSYLFTLHQMRLESPSDLFASLVVAYFFSMRGGNLDSRITANEILEHPKLERLMKVELGMFKSEQTFVAKALQLVTLLTQKKEIMNRGERRRKALMNSESFSFALQLAAREHLLSAHDVQFWQKEFTAFESHPQREGSNGENHQSRRKRYRNRPRRPRN